MTVRSKVPRGQWYIGERKELVFTLTHPSDEDPETWELQFVLRYASCVRGLEDPGDGGVIFTKDTADMTVVVLTTTTARITVVVDREDTVGLDPDDYHGALWRIDGTDDAVLATLVYAHLSGVAKQSS